MTYDPRSFVVRRPRHSANGDRDSRIWLEEVDTPDLLQRDVRLCDFSRKGAKLELVAPMTPNAAVRLHVENSEMKIAVALPARIRWQRRVDEGCWALGCLFDEEVPYEVIGEMFLSGVLDMESRSR